MNRWSLLINNVILPLSSAYLLVSHGSRDLRPQVAVDGLVQLLSEHFQRLGDSNASWQRQAQPEYEGGALMATSSSTRQTIAPSHAPLIGTAVLELHPLPLHQQIQQFAEQAIASGYNHLQIIPLFLLPGVHVMEDIPAEVAIAQNLLKKRISLEVCPHLGGCSRLQDLLTLPSEISSGAQKILLSHGSRRPGGNAPVEAIAAAVGAEPAYWSVAPSLESQVNRLVKMGCQAIVILPYFLFEGAITDAIAENVQQISQQFPYIHLHLAKPLGASQELADLILDLIHT